MNTNVFQDTENFLDEMLNKGNSAEDTQTTTTKSTSNTPTTEEIKQKLQAEKNEVEVIELEAEEVPNEEPKQQSRTDFVTDAMAEESADFLIWALDFFQSLIFKLLAKRKLAKKAKTIAGEDYADALQEAIKKVKENRAKKEEGVEYVLEDEEKALLDLKQRFDDFCETIDLDDKEIKMLKRCFKDVIKTKQFNLSPEMRLLITASIIIASRSMSLSTI